MNKLILVTNDDSIHSKGIKELVSVARLYGRVVVVAPDKPQSGKGHAITIEDTIRCDKVTIDGGLQEEYACSGTPVDCVKLAVNKILDRKPDLCVSGINHGSNSSINVIYSGTMSAAVESALENIPAIGFSLLDYNKDADFSESEAYIRRITKKVLENGLADGICLNVNIPKSIKGRALKGVKVCRQANANWVEEFEERTDPKGRVYYWLTGKFVNYDSGKDTDEWALANHYISVVPVKFDVTDYSALPSVTKLLIDG